MCAMFYTSISRADELEMTVHSANVSWGSIKKKPLNIFNKAFFLAFNEGAIFIASGSEYLSKYYTVIEKLCEILSKRLKFKRLNSYETIHSPDIAISTDGVAENLNCLNRNA